MSTEPEVAATAASAPDTRGSSVPAVLGLLLTLGAIAAVGYFAFYEPSRAPGGAPAAHPEVVQGGGSPAAPATRAGGAKTRR
jgi:hypothetical protein